MSLILASTSASRRAMLEAAGVPHACEPPHVDEEAATAALATQGHGPAALADALAELKALRVSARHPEALVLGADQVLALDDGTRLDKPLTRETLARQLLRLSGQPHRLFAAAVLARAGAPLWRHTGIARLHVRTLSADFIARYAARVPDAVLHSVGGYHVEALGVQLFESIEGDLFTVRGLPLLPLLAQLRRMGELPA